MSPGEIKYLLLGLIPLAFITVWLVAEAKDARRLARVVSGITPLLSFSIWLLALSNSLGSYYDGMREHRMLQSLIRAYPEQTREVNAWEAEYKFYKDFEYHSKKLNELEAIIQTER